MTENRVIKFEGRSIETTQFKAQMGKKRRMEETNQQVLRDRWDNIKNSNNREWESQRIGEKTGQKRRSGRIGND